ncbi:MAG: alpha/beta hydrolase [Myxococcaceae bacterium]
MRWTLAVLLLTSCYSLDPFLYQPNTIDQYTFVGASTDPLEDVAADRIEALSIQVSPRVTLGAVYVKAKVQPPRGHALYFHGKGDHLGASQFPRIKRLANAGYDVLGFDYRGFGASTALAPDEAGVDEDTRAVHAYLVGRVGTGDILFYGHSFGAAAALQRAVGDPPRWLILEAAFASIQGFVRDSSGTDLPWTFFAHDSWDNVARIGTIQVPVLLLHGQDDDFVRPEFSEKLFAHANEPKQLQLVPGAKHDVAQSLGAAYGPAVNAFTSQY